ncbi:MAG: hypothetical protein GY696_01935 [Gammaproteobacteria bacterium]|nr:hypothetical protein [Gammaproteobacteria bacterium]
MLPLSYLDEEIELVTFKLSIHATESSHNDLTRPTKSHTPTEKKGQIVLTAEVATEDEGEHTYSGESNGQVQKTADKPPTPKLEQTGPGSTPKSMQCNNCNKEHTHLFYCKHFESSEVKERIKIATASN